MEQVRTVAISVEIDTNKATYTEMFDDADAFVEWWNARAAALRLEPIDDLPPERP